MKTRRSYIGTRPFVMQHFTNRLFLCLLCYGFCLTNCNATDAPQGHVEIQLIAIVLADKIIDHPDYPIIVGLSPMQDILTLRKLLKRNDIFPVSRWEKIRRHPKLFSDKIQIWDVHVESLHGERAILLANPPGPGAFGDEYTLRRTGGVWRIKSIRKDACVG